MVTHKAGGVQDDWSFLPKRGCPCDSNSRRLRQGEILDGAHGLQDCFTLTSPAPPIHVREGVQREDGHTVYKVDHSSSLTPIPPSRTSPHPV